MDRSVVSWILAALVMASVAGGWWGVSRAEREALEATGRLKAETVARESAEAVAAQATERLEAMKDSVQSVRSRLAAEQEAALAKADAAAESFERAAQNARAVTRDSADAALIDSLVVSHEAEVTALRTANESLRAERAVLLERIEATDAALAEKDAVIERLHAELQTAIERGDAWERAAKPGVTDWVQRAVIVVLIGDRIFG